MVFTFLYVCLKKSGYHLEYLWIFCHVGDVALYINHDQKLLPVWPLLIYTKSFLSCGRTKHANHCFFRGANPTFTQISLFKYNLSREIVVMMVGVQWQC